MDEKTIGDGTSQKKHEKGNYTQFVAMGSTLWLQKVGRKNTRCRVKKGTRSDGSIAKKCLVIMEELSLPVPEPH